MHTNVYNTFTKKIYRRPKENTINERYILV